MVQEIWNKISNYGISEEHLDENSLIRLYNQMSFLSIIGAIGVTACSIYFQFHFLYSIVAFSISIIYILVIFFNSFGKIYLSRLIISIGSPLWVGTINLLFAGFFSQSVAILVSMAITYVGFHKSIKVRNGLLIYSVLLYISSIIYTTIYGSIVKVNDYPIDEIIVFIGGLGWIIIVLVTFNKDREKLIVDLQEKNAQLKNATEELERFSYIASHDLKSPLRTITSFIGLIERDIKNGNYETVQDKLHFVKSGAEQMNFLIQDILELSKLRSNETSERILVDLNMVLEKAKINLTEEINQNNVIIYSDDLPQFYCNEVEFLLLFQNFIQNGIKYNDNKNPIISIIAYETDTTFSLSFRDNGIGIAKEYHEQIFQFFKRLHNSDEYQGTGLGLGLCRKIIKNHGGEVEVDSEEGAGSTFTLIFPLENYINPKQGEKLLATTK